MKRTPEPDGPPLSLTGEGVVWLGATVLLGGLGWYKSINIVLLLAYVMFVVLFLNGILARVHARRVVAVREEIPPPFAGEEITAGIAATNTGRRPATATVEDRAAENGPTWLVHDLPAGWSVTCLARRSFPARGRYPGSVRVSSAYPFGLLRYEHPGAGAEVVVLPAAGVADADGLRRWLRTQTGGDGRSRKLLRRVTTDQADVRGVRPFRPGDSIRAIHWKSSARRRELMVREYDAAPAPDLVLVVEPWLPAEPSQKDCDALEAALSLAATVVRTWSRVYGTRATLAVASDPGSVRTTTPTDSGVRHALEPLAAVGGGSGFPPLSPQAFDRSLARSARVVVSSRPGSEYADDLSRSTGRRFLPVCSLDRLPWYQPPPLTPSGVRPESAG